MCSKSDVKKIVDNKIDNLEISLIKIIKEEVKFSLKDIPIHKTAPNTKAELANLKNSILGFEKTQKEILLKINEVHNFYTGAKFLQKAIIWFFGLLGVVAGGIIACRELFRN